MRTKRKNYFAITFYYLVFLIVRLVYKTKICNMYKLLKKIEKKIFDAIIVKKGSIEFTTGDHEVFVKTKCSKQEKVWIHLSDSCEPTCSYIDKDMFSVKEDLCGGFVISAHVESNKRKVYWFVK